MIFYLERVILAETFRLSGLVDLGANASLILKLNIPAMDEQFEDQQFVEFVVKSIVDNPDKVRTTRVIDEMGVLITLDVDSADMGQVIGRSGQTAKSIRTLLKVVGAKNNARVNLKINEPEGGKRTKERQEGAEGMGMASAPAAMAAPVVAPVVDEDPMMMDPTGSVADDLKL